MPRQYVVTTRSEDGYRNIQYFGKRYGRTSNANKDARNLSQENQETVYVEEIILPRTYKIISTWKYQAPDSPIIKALKYKLNMLRIDNQDTWLVWDDAKDEWIVYHHAYRSRNSVELYRGTNEELAVDHLLSEK